MKTLLASLIGLGLLVSSANAQHIGFRHHGYGAGPEICAPEVIHQPRQAISVMPRVVAAAPSEQQTIEAPAVANPAPADQQPAPSETPAPLQAPLPPS